MATEKRANAIIVFALFLPPCAFCQTTDAPSLQPPHHIGSPEESHAVNHRAFTGVPSLAIEPQGRIWATWYAGPTPREDLNNYVVLSTSGDGGATWQEALVIDPDGEGPVRAFDPQLWVSPDGRLFHFWSQMEKGRHDNQLVFGAGRLPNPSALNRCGPLRAGWGTAS